MWGVREHSPISPLAITVSLFRFIFASSETQSHYAPDTSLWQELSASQQPGSEPAARMHATHFYTKQINNCFNRQYRVVVGPASVKACHKFGSLSPVQARLQRGDNQQCQLEMLWNVSPGGVAGDATSPDWLCPPTVGGRRSGSFCWLGCEIHGDRDRWLWRWQCSLEHEHTANFGVGFLPLLCEQGGKFLQQNVDKLFFAGSSPSVDTTKWEKRRRCSRHASRYFFCFSRLWAASN